MAETSTRELASSRARGTRVVAVFCALAILLAVLFALNLCLGTFEIPLSELWGILASGNDGTTASQVVWEIRLPRLVAAVVLGGALALSGFLLQTFFNNPIASPYVLGVSSGAEFAVALVMIAVVGSAGQLSSWMLVVAAFAGALVVMLVVLLISRRIASMATLILAGVMIGYVCSAGTDFLVTFASDADIVNLRNWSKGSFSGVGWDDVGVMCAIVVPCAVAVFLLAKPTGAFLLGEDYARSVGVRLVPFRVALVLLSSLLAATVTAFAGPISFVGVAAPHIVKRLLGTAKPLYVVPAAFLGGAVFCLFCDLIARMAFAPTEMSISAVTAIFGAPVVIAILLHRRKGAQT